MSILFFHSSTNWGGYYQNKSDKIYVYFFSLFKQEWGHGQIKKKFVKVD